MTTKNKKNLAIAGIILIVVTIAGVLFFFKGSAMVPVSNAEAKIGSVTAEVKVSGQVKASQGADLAFERSGKISANYVKAGDKVYAGQPLIALNDADLLAQLSLAKAQLSALNLDVLNSGNGASLQSLYMTALSAAQKSTAVAKNSLMVISDIQFSHFSGATQKNFDFADAKAKAVDSLLGQSSAGFWTSSNLANLGGGAFGAVESAIASSTNDAADAALSQTLGALQDVEAAINAMPIDSSLNSTERASIITEKNNVNQEIMTTQANIQAIAVKKVTNNNSVTTTDAQIEAAKANVQSVQVQISKTILTAPFSGQVDKDDAVVGSLITPGVSMVSVSNGNLEIQTSIPEVDVANINAGDIANVTLDAYGNNVVFQAKVYSVDSAQTLVNGVPAYNAKLRFSQADDRIKPGMTANITILSETRSNVLVIPQSAIIQRNGQYFVVIDKGNSRGEEREVQIGLKGSDGNVEITSGLNPGDRVLTY